MVLNLSCFTLLSVVFSLSACTNGTNQNEAPAAAVTPVMVPAEKGDIVFSYEANGKTYRLLARYDRLLRGYSTALNITSGGTFDGSDDEDREAQNTIRDAYRAHNVCKSGLHPGIIQLGYGFSAKMGGWAARVKCTEKQQANI